MNATNIVAVEAAGRKGKRVGGFLVQIQEVCVVALICVGAVGIESEPPPTALYARPNIARGGASSAGGDTRNIGPSRIATRQLIDVAARLRLALGDGYSFGKYFIDIVKISGVRDFNRQRGGLWVSIRIFNGNGKAVGGLIHAG